MIEMSLDELERLAKEDLEKVGDETALSWIELCVELTGELPEEAVVNV